MTADLSRRFSIDPQRVYLAGMSGGARVAMRIALANKNIAGVIASSGADSPERSQARRMLRSITVGASGRVQDREYLMLLERSRPQGR